MAQDNKGSSDTRSLPDNILNTLENIKCSGFQNIKVTLRIIGILPVTSC